MCGERGDEIGAFFKKVFFQCPKGILFNSELALGHHFRSSCYRENCTRFNSPQNTVNRPTMFKYKGTVIPT